ncbi:MAG: 50S ribosomal protein L6 [Bacilli bacterium]|nr:50S ribosomal protein L6 [Bacilli bacterium]
MSRIGSRVIKIPNGVSLTKVDNNVEIKGQHGRLLVKLPKNIVCEIQDNEVFVKRLNDTKAAKEMHGTIRTHINNAVYGVSNLFKKELEVRGTGYTANIENNKLVLNVGFSKSITLIPKEGIKITCDNNIITVTGINKQLVGEQAAIIRRQRKPDPYKGNGIRYVNEHVATRVGKRTESSSVVKAK